MLYCLDSTADLWEFAGPSHWNDPDMLEVGNESRESTWGNISIEKMNVREYTSHFVMWAMAAAPLIAGNDLREIPLEVRDILLNSEVIAVDQDALGQQGRRVKKMGNVEVWRKELTGDRWAVAMLNVGDKTDSIKFSWDEVGIQNGRKVRNIERHSDLGLFAERFESRGIKSHGIEIIIVQ